MSTITLDRNVAAELDLDLEVLVVENEPQMQDAASLTLTCAALCAPSWRIC